MDGVRVTSNFYLSLSESDGETWLIQMNRSIDYIKMKKRIERK